jgi:hypothetical protein
VPPHVEVAIVVIIASVAFIEVALVAIVTLVSDVIIFVQVAGGYFQ